MAEAISGPVVYPFRWFFRPESGPVAIVTQVVDAGEELNFDELPSILAEIDDRHWKAVRQILIEAKVKAEAQLRNDEIIKSSQLTTYYQGWVAYADYILANFEGLRSGEDAGQQIQPTMDVR